MKTVIYWGLILLIFGCVEEQKFNASEYYSLINKAELSICDQDYEQASEYYKQAFNFTLKPYGKDAFNAALVGAISGDEDLRDQYLQLIINNSDDLSHVKTQFVNNYITFQEWNNLVANKVIAYDQELRAEMAEMMERDQMFRPDYDNYDDTINHIRIIHINRLLNLTEASGYPSHLEIGYQPFLISQQHDIVLHHSAQRRSRDKTVTDLEPLLKKAIQQGRFDPERAISYMRFQNDKEKGRFETYNTWQYRHPFLPDSLNSKIWLPKLSEKEKEEANAIRRQWYANTIDDIMTKTSFKNQSAHPFIFSSVKMSVANLRNDLPEDEIMLQYQAFTGMMKAFNQEGM